MRRCEYCGREEWMPYTCSYCGGTFCSEHRLPESHDCPGLKEDYWNVPVKVKKKRRFSISIPRASIPRTGIAAYGYNNLIIGICTIAFFLSIIFPDFRWLMILHPDWIASNPLFLWQLVTNIFFHGGFEHYLFNMLVLLFFGGELERRVGSSTYLRVFLLSGVAGSLGYMAFAYATNPGIAALGASGAIYGVMGCLAIIAPEIRVMLLFLPIPMGIRQMILLFAAIDLLLLPVPDRIAHSAHLAGLFVGLYYGKKLRILRRWRMW